MTCGVLPFAQPRGCVEQSNVSLNFFSLFFLLFWVWGGGGVILFLQNGCDDGNGEKVNGYVGSQRGS